MPTGISGMPTGINGAAGISGMPTGIAGGMTGMPQMGTPQTSQYWYCKSCNKTVGTGSSPPNISSCPYCGIRIIGYDDPTTGQTKSIPSSSDSSGSSFFDRVDAKKIGIGIGTLIGIGVVIAVIVSLSAAAKSKPKKRRRVRDDDDDDDFTPPSRRRW